ncbi:MAG TPA: CsbD family protein, partial [Devosia sp.]|nr:CsbD family protein [Devosia sp.]
MHKDQVEGAGKQMKGAVKDAAGKMSGDVKLQAEGKMDKAAGQVQSAVGKAKDDARN